jgi:spore coat protein U-like protein
MIREMRTAAAIFAVTVLAGPSALAADQASFAVSARVESLCTVGDRPEPARVEVRCTRGTSYNLSLDRGHAEAVTTDGAYRITVSDRSGIVLATITY